MNSQAKAPLTDVGMRLDPAHVALMVIDFQNDFCAPGGWTEALTKKDMGVFLPVREALGRLVDSARRAKVPVVWVRADYRPETLPEPMRVRFASIPGLKTCCEPGTWGYDWFGPKPAEGELVIDKHCYSGFMGTDLDAQLRKRGIRSIVYTGVQTNACVESTLRDGHSLGYYCVVPRDCVASHTPERHNEALITMGFLFADVVDEAAVAARWGG